MNQKIPNNTVAALVAGSTASEEEEVKDLVEEVEEEEKEEEETSAEETEVEETEVEDDAADDDDAEDDDEEEDDQISLLKTQNKQLQDRLAKIEADAKAKEAEEEEEEDQQLALEDVDFLGEEEDFDDLFQDKAKLNRLLNAVYKKGAVASAEHSLKVAPKITRKIAQQEIGSQLLVRDFWRENQTLRNHRQEVATVYEMIRQQDPNKSEEEIFAELPAKTRAYLSLNDIELEEETKQSGTKTKQAPKKRGSHRGAGLPAGSSRKSTTSQQGGEQKKPEFTAELDKMARAGR